MANKGSVKRKDRMRDGHRRKLEGKKESINVGKNGERKREGMK